MNLSVILPFYRFACYYFIKLYKKTQLLIPDQAVRSPSAPGRLQA